MEIVHTPLAGVFELAPTVFEDARGYFFESFSAARFESISGLKLDFVQDNESLSQKGVVRGLHFQIGASAQDKLVRVSQGAVQDVIVDLRSGSKTFGQHYATILSAENKRQLFVPAGFAHGFAVLENDSVFSYKCSNYYDADSERCMLWNDPALEIDWSVKNALVSEKDQQGLTFSEVKEKDFFGK